MKLDLSEWNIKEMILDDDSNSLKIIADNDSLEILFPETAFKTLVKTTT